jgi:DNA polymerase-1
MPHDLQPQIGLIREMLNAMAIPAVELRGYEADDLLATVAAEVERLGGECYLVTADKDCRQLISEHTKMLNIRKGEIYDAASLMQTWGIRPDQVVDFQSLVGDPTDGVPGVPLVGPKLAKELLAQFGTLENLYDHVSEVAGQKRRENLLTHRQQALLSRELVRLRRDVPLALDWSTARTGQMDAARVAAMCERFGFRRLAERLAKFTGQKSGAAWAATCHQVVSDADFESLLTTIAPVDRVALWMEIAGDKPHEQTLQQVAVAVGGDEAWCLRPASETTAFLERLQRLFDAIGNRGVGHDVKRYWNAFQAAGKRLPDGFRDLMVADYLLHAGQRSHDLPELAARYLQVPPESLGTAKASSAIDSADAIMANRAAIIGKLEPLLAADLHREQLDSLYQDLELPLIEVLSSIEMTGIRIDVARLQALSARLASRLGELESEIYALAGSRFNLDSPMQLSKVLFDDLGLRCVKRTKTGRSTDAEVLEELAAEHPLPARIVEYRQLAKLKNTYADALPQAVSKVTGRIHTTLKQDVAATGRLSSHDPNLQNIPIRTSLGAEIRAAIIPGEPGWKLLAADYSQIELRVLAHYCSDEALRDAFARDEDIHRRVAAEVYAVSPDAVTSEMRRTAKAVNFGILYGQSAFGLAKSLGIDTGEAEAFIEAYFARYPGVDAFMNGVLEEAARNGFVQTILGRRRLIQGVRSAARRGTSRQRNLPERLAINTIIQGSAADLIKLAMLGVYRRLQREKCQARLLLQIHDELLFEVPAGDQSALAGLVVEEMSRVGSLSVPLRVDVKVGDNWAECEPLL